MKNKTIAVDELILDRLQSVCNTTGLSVKSLAGHLIRDGLDRIEKGGGVQISVLDGSIKIPPPAPVMNPAMLGGAKVGAARPTEPTVREIDMSAFKQQEKN